MSLERKACLHTGTLNQSETLNPSICDAYFGFDDDPAIRRSHLFGGRYENVYIGLDKIPAMQQVMSQAEAYAAQILGLPVNGIRSGFWFNVMQPGHSTTAHTHDDDDELLSAVYYLKVPENSGELILYDDPLTIHVTPKAGMFVFFPPELKHAVSRNCSQTARLSVGINFGPATG